MLQFITHQTPRFGIIEGAVAALNGGCKWIQLRMKGAPIEAVRQTAQQLIPLCKEHEAILIKALQNANIKIIGEPSFARYNSPFALWFMRRNEIMIEVQR